MKLIMHIGLGKTGTTALQSFFNKNEGYFFSRGVIYAGTRLQNILKESALPHIGSIDDAASLERGLINLEKEFRSRKVGAKTLLWSNEAFSMSHNPDGLISALNKFIARSEVFDKLEIYLVLRRQDQWLESAYKQWALKHKVYKGAKIQSPEEFVDSMSYLLNYQKLVDAWSNADGALRVSSYDAVMAAGGIVKYMTGQLDIDISDDLSRTETVHESLDNVKSMFLSIHNSLFDEELFPKDLLSAINDAGKITLSSGDDRMFISSSLREKVLREFSSGNDYVEKNFFPAGERFNDDVVVNRALYEHDYIKYIALLEVICANQQRRIGNLNRRLLAVESLLNI